MAMIPVVVIEVPDPQNPGQVKYRVRPSSVILGHGDHFRITNHTSQSPLNVLLPAGPPAPLGNVVALPPTPAGKERIQIGPPHPTATEGDYIYQVFVGGHEAEGESAPHVIIDP